MTTRLLLTCAAIAVVLGLASIPNAYLFNALAGLVATPFVPTGIAALIAWVLLGILIELPFLLAAYRYWRPWLFWVSGVFITAFYTFYWGLFYDTPSLGPVVMIGQPAILLAAMLFATGVALLLARLIGRTGVLRGVQGAVDRRRSRVSAEAPAA